MSLLYVGKGSLPSSSRGNIFCINLVGISRDGYGGGSVASVNVGRERRRCNREPSGSTLISVAATEGIESVALPLPFSSSMLERSRRGLDNRLTMLLEAWWYRVEGRSFGVSDTRLEVDPGVIQLIESDRVG